MLDSQPAEFVRAKTAPETQQHQRPVANAREALAPVGFPGDLLIDPGRELFELRELHGFRPLLGCGMQRDDASEDLAHVRCLRRIRKTLRLMPLRERCKPRAQGIDRQGFCVIGKVPRDHVSARWQKAAPFDLEMPECRLVTAPGCVFARRGFDVAIDGRHGSWVKSGDLYRRR
ncbi:MULTISPECIES: hypothetical protein [unclassified Caballeronia]|uniref:hypothetical protein n=1 Tax=unclassified Caballeronia TaxID=2646786 RepID=UPI002029A62F|nr:MULTISPECIES: hypothetical protein [unclassified Caballeronia]